MIKDDFISDDYSVPTTGSNYCKFEDGPTKIRILTSPLFGRSIWTKEDDKNVKIIEKHTGDKPNYIPKNVQTNKGKNVQRKHFWLMLVYNYNEKKLQILDLDKASIQNSIMNIYGMEEYGDPRKYDIKVLKKGKLLDTTYDCNPLPPTEFTDKKVLEEVKKINLNVYFEGLDPFENQSVEDDQKF